MNKNSHKKNSRFSKKGEKKYKLKDEEPLLNIIIIKHKNTNTDPIKV
jgi:hypothetical protein